MTRATTTIVLLLLTIVTVSTSQPTQQTTILTSNIPGAHHHQTNNVLNNALNFNDSWPSFNSPRLTNLFWVVMYGILLAGILFWQYRNHIVFEWDSDTEDIENEEFPIAPVALLLLDNPKKNIKSFVRSEDDCIMEERPGECQQPFNNTQEYGRFTGGNFLPHHGEEPYQFFDEAPAFVEDSVLLEDVLHMTEDPRQPHGDEVLACVTEDPCQPHADEALVCEDVRPMTQSHGDEVLVCVTEDPSEPHGDEALVCEDVRPMTQDPPQPHGDEALLSKLMLQHESAVIAVGEEAPDISATVTPEFHTVPAEEKQLQIVVDRPAAETAQSTHNAPYNLAQTYIVHAPKSFCQPFHKPNYELRKRARKCGNCIFVGQLYKESTPIVLSAVIHMLFPDWVQGKDVDMECQTTEFHEPTGCAWVYVSTEVQRDLLLAVNKQLLIVDADNQCLQLMVTRELVQWLPHLEVYNYGMGGNALLQVIAHHRYPLPLHPNMPIAVELSKKKTQTNSSNSSRNNGTRIPHQVDAVVPTTYRHNPYNGNGLFPLH